MKWVMGRAGVGVSSVNRITLLRDADGMAWVPGTAGAGGSGLAPPVL